MEEQGRARREALKHGLCIRFVVYCCRSCPGWSVVIPHTAAAAAAAAAAQIDCETICVDLGDPLTTKKALEAYTAKRRIDLLVNNAAISRSVGRQRDCHFAGTPTTSLLRRLLKGDGGAAE